MYNSTLALTPVDEDVARGAGREAGVDSERVYLFGDVVRFLEEFLKLKCCQSCALIGAGHVTADIAMAANGAEIELIEALNDSPFTGDVARVLKAVRSSRDIIYLANPNLITGVVYSRVDVRRVCSEVPEGIVIVDERLAVGSVETAASLTEDYTNLMVVRSFRTLRSMPAMSAGFAVADRGMIAAIGESISPGRLSRAMREKVLCGDIDEEALRRQTCHESLRIATELTRLGIQCQTTQAEFLLIRVANVKDTGNFLTANQVTVENLDGYPQMRHYLRYRLGSPERNDGLLAAFRRMPLRCYRAVDLDKRRVKRLGEAKKSTARGRRVL